MPTAFERADARSSAAVSKLYGKTFRLLPWRRIGDYSGARDLDRPEVDFVATLSGAVQRENIGGDRGSNFGASVTVTEKVFSIDRLDLPPGMQDGDRVVELVDGEPFGPTYKVDAPSFDGANRYIVQAATVTR